MRFQPTQTRSILSRPFAGLILALALLCGPALLAAQTPTPSLSYEQVRAALDAAEAEARSNGWNVTIVVVDTAGIPLQLRRLDGASVMSYNFAMGKARTSAATGLTTLEYRQRLEAGSMEPIEEGLTIEGGVPLFVGGRLVGAIATSGVAAQNDAVISRAGAAVIGR